ncbi:carbohydrate esterase family 5 protein [Polychaeton citri CBS 116435]|uniref:Carbohydrate esterase family 5 protein n=1 Tax=Polychaeton citri CBS 116435 TaxID=1314669 RepID=A0A9P4Q7F5_9PEZI|nr:carbohydrate esterase family 5 protein [Polychaeton citri CBS 116435]
MLLPKVALTLLLSLPFAVTSPIPTGIEERVTCYSGVYIISTRGSTEPQGEGSIGAVSSMIKARVPNSASTGTVYPATLSNYQSSENQGVTALTSAIKSYVDACGASSRVVLLGYSQGAQVIADVLSGSPSTGSPPISSSQYGKYIKSAILFGDPSFVVGQSYDAGTSTTSGIFPRPQPQLSTLATYGSRIRSYCDAGDPFCAGGNNLAVHQGYVSKYGTAATDFVVSKV